MSMSCLSLVNRMLHVHGRHRLLLVLWTLALVHIYRRTWCQGRLSNSKGTNERWLIFDDTLIHHICAVVHFIQATDLA